MTTWGSRPTRPARALAPLLLAVALTLTSCSGGDGSDFETSPSEAPPETGPSEPSPSETASGPTAAAQRFFDLYASYECEEWDQMFVRPGAVEDCEGAETFERDVMSAVEIGDEIPLTDEQRSGLEEELANGSERYPDGTTVDDFVLVEWSISDRDDSETSTMALVDVDGEWKIDSTTFGG